MTATLTLTTLVIYVALLFVVAHLSRRQGGRFTGGHNQSWWVVALAMVGAPMTGITFISVPGGVGATGFSYLQMALGFVVGSVVIARWLLPLYYRYNVTSLYEYLSSRFGECSHAVGAWLFLVAKVVGASLRIFVVCVVIQQLLCNTFGVPFWVTATLFVALAWLYTYRGGVAAVVWTDALKSVCMVLCVVLCGVFLLRQLDLSVVEAARQASEKGFTKTIFFDDIDSSLHFVKMFFAGIFMIVAMTGLDQDMMQRALTSRTLRSAQRNMVGSSLLQTVVIALLLGVGALLHLYLAFRGESVATPDQTFAFVAMQEGVPSIVAVLLVLGVVSASFSSTGGALTALTTAFMVDVLQNRDISEQKRKAIHAAVALVLVALVLAFERWSTASSLDMFYRIVSYAYGPLLALFFFGVVSQREVRDRFVPVVVVASPIVCGVLDHFSTSLFGGYEFGFEVLLLNALTTFMGLLLISKKGSKIAKI